MQWRAQGWSNSENGMAHSPQWHELRTSSAREAWAPELRYNLPRYNIYIYVCICMYVYIHTWVLLLFYGQKKIPMDPTTWKVLNAPKSYPKYFRRYLDP
jgi:hypothetical protein